MTIEENRFYLPVRERGDMRMIVAYELGRSGADKRVANSFDGIIKEHVAQVFVSDDEDERVLLKIKSDGEIAYILITETGIMRADPRQIRLAAKPQTTKQ